MRRFAAGFLVVCFTVLWTATIVAGWTHEQALSTNGWVKTSGRLLDSDTIRHSVAQIVFAELSDAGPLSLSLNDDVLRSASVKRAFEDANRDAHETLMAMLAGHSVPGDEVVLDLTGVLLAVGKQAGVPEQALNEVPEGSAAVVVLRSDQLHREQQLAYDLHRAFWVLLLLSLACFVGVLAMHPRFSVGAAEAGAGLVVAGVVVLLVRALFSHHAVDLLSLGSGNDAAVRATLSIATSTMTHFALGSIVAGVVLALIGAIVALLLPPRDDDVGYSSPAYPVDVRVR